MKRFAACLLALVLLLGTACAQDVTCYNYHLEGESACIDYCSDNYKAELVVPETLGGHPVAQIGREAFAYLINLKSLQLPGSLVSIADDAFTGCSGLTEVQLGIRLVLNDGNPFADCENLRSITLSGKSAYLYLHEGVLYSKRNMQLVCCPAALKMDSYQIPAGTKAIGSDAFSGCAIGTLVIPSTVNFIHEHAFRGVKGELTLEAAANAYARDYAIQHGMAYAQNVQPQEEAPTPAPEPTAAPTSTPDAQPAATPTAAAQTSSGISAALQSVRSAKGAWLDAATTSEPTATPVPTATAASTSTPAPKDDYETKVAAALSAFRSQSTAEVPKPTAAPTSTPSPTPAPTAAPAQSSLNVSLQDMLASMSFDELCELAEHVQLALWESDGWQEVTVPAGSYRVGTEIPAGKWVVEPVEGQTAIVKWNCKDANASSGGYDYEQITSPTDSYYQYNKSTSVIVDLTSGTYLVVKDAPVIFKPYTSTSLGFK